MNKFFQKIFLINYLDLFAYLISFFFLIALISKLIYPKDFLLILDRYTLLPDSLLRLVSIIIIALELGVAIMLISHQFRKNGALLALTILSVFLIFKAYHLIKKTGAKCGCFALIHNGEITILDVTINCILILFCILILIKHYQTATYIQRR